ncbi:MAG: rod-determining factor RdfA [Halobacteriota archaeon]
MNESPPRSDGSPSPTGRSKPNSKVDRVISKYDLSGLGERLEAYWIGDADEQFSLRQLAVYFNQRVLRKAMIDAGMDPLKGEVENTYNLLTDDDVTGGVRTQAEKALQREGIDVDELTRDFVSHQAVHTYLTKYRGVSRGENETEEDQVEKGIEAIQRLKSRVTAVTEKTLTTLKNTGRITLGEFDVLVDVRVFCSDCGTQYEVSELLRQRGCDCDDDAS